LLFELVLKLALLGTLALESDEKLDWLPLLKDANDILDEAPQYFNVSRWREATHGLIQL